ncbi:MAG: LysR family transcriptional regulator [Rhodobacteraceae bacterium]|nr:LysR family transcriptional regulator [Paracoccaceae bacterium]
MSSSFRQYQAFHATMIAGTVTGAAEQLGISQPGISNLLGQLERTTRFKLFERSRGRLIPTPEAALLFEDVDTLVRGLDHVNQAVIDLQNQEAGQLQVATNHSVAFGLMPEMLKSFTTGRPNMTISFQSQFSTRVQEWVMAGLFEVGICELPLRHDGLTARNFYFETVCAIPEDSPLADYDVLTPEALDNYPFIIIGSEHMVNRRVRETFQAHGAKWRIRCHTDLFRNALNMVKQGFGATLVDPFTLFGDDGEGYVVRRFEPRILLDLVIVTARDRPLSLTGRQFVEHATERLTSMAIDRG